LAWVEKAFVDRFRRRFGHNPGLVCTNAGDSGGPTLGWQLHLQAPPPWDIDALEVWQEAVGWATLDGAFDAGRFLIGTTQNGGGTGQLVAMSDMAPLAGWCAPVATACRPSAPLKKKWSCTARSITTATSGRRGRRC
jgi:hypothetical protein